MAGLGLMQRMKLHLVVASCVVSARIEATKEAATVLGAAPLPATDPRWQRPNRERGIESLGADFLMEKIFDKEANLRSGERGKERRIDG